MLEQRDIQLARIADAGQVAIMSRDLIEHGLGWSWTPSRVRGAIRKTECNVAVAKSGREVTGFGIMDYGLDSAHLVLFAVHPHVRRQQIGTRLLRWLEDTAEVAGLQYITLETRFDNQAGRRFYARNGYRETGVVRGYYGGRESAVQMRRTLRPPPPGTGERCK